MKPRLIDRHFRWREESAGRIEGFSDAVFAFAMTLLVVSLQVPRTFHELVELIRGLPAFLICFVFLVMIWVEHYLFTRRYGIRTMYALVLNTALLFLVLFYVYPLKFLFGVLLHVFTGQAVGMVGPDGTWIPPLAVKDMPSIMIIYGLGYVAVYSVFCLLYRSVLRRKQDYFFNEIELLLTRQQYRSNGIMVGVGSLSILIALTIPGEYTAMWAGFAYFLIGPIQAINGWRSGVKLKKLLSRERTESRV